MINRNTPQRTTLWGRHHKDVNGVALSQDDVRTALNSPHDLLKRQLTAALVMRLNASLLQLLLLNLLRPKFNPRFFCRKKRHRVGGTIDDEDDVYRDPLCAPDNWATFFKPRLVGGKPIVLDAELENVSRPVSLVKFI